MNVNRGDVILVDYPYSRGGGAKVRPALIVQNDRDNRRLYSTVIAQITSRTDRAEKEATQFLIDLMTAEGKQSGLRNNSAVNCVNLFTIHRDDLLRRLGSLSTAAM
jgi:mRNA interferase MazF